MLEVQSALELPEERHKDIIIPPKIPEVYLLSRTKLCVVPSFLTGICNVGNGVGVSRHKANLVILEEGHLVAEMLESRLCDSFFE